MAGAAGTMTEPLATPAAPAATPVAARAPAAAWYALGVLTVVTLFAYLDRGVLILQADVIKRALALTDFQVGLMQGTGVAIFAGLAAYPLGWLADRFDRRKVLAGCVLLWSAAVVAGGLAPNYELLLLSTAMVGGAEAGLVPIIYAMIPELFPPHRRQTANSVYALAAQATGGLALALTGALIGGVETLRPLLPAGLGAIEGWRLAFFLAALPAPVMVLALFTVRIPKRGQTDDTDAAVATDPQPSVGALQLAAPVLPFLRAHWQTFLCFYGGVGLAIFGFNCVGSWLAVIYARVFGQSPQQVGSVLGAVALVGTALGFLLSIYGMRYLGPRVGTRMNIRLLWIPVLSAVVTFTMMVFATSASQMYAIQGIYIFLVTTAVMVYPSALQTLAPNALRTRIVAIMSVLSAALVAVAPPLVGLVSDQFQQRPNGLILAAVLVAVPALLVSAALLYRCESLYLRTAEAVRRIDGIAV
jgi:MFS family permease